MAAAESHEKTENKQAAGRNSRLYRPAAGTPTTPASKSAAAGTTATPSSPPPPPGASIAGVPPPTPPPPHIAPPSYDRMIMSGTSLEEPEGYWPHAKGAKHGAAQTEARQLADEAVRLERWFKSGRFSGLEPRRYSGREVAAMRGTLPPVEGVGARQARKLWQLLKQAKDTRGHLNTFGMLDPVQVTQSAKYLSTAYVSGWQCSSTAATSNEPGPDFADYPMDTVPNKVDHLVRAQLFHDRKQKVARARMSEHERSNSPPVDYLNPVIADGDTGFGGITSVMKLTKMMIEAGAAGMHIEDQRSGSKKCGHMAGKVLTSTAEHVDRLCAARMQADVSGSELVLISRTDAEAAQLIDSNIDPRDAPFILGEVGYGDEPILKTYPDAVAQACTELAGQHASVGPSMQALEEWHARAMSGKLTLREMQDDAKSSLGIEVPFDWETCRTDEGYYRVKATLEHGIARAKSFAPYCDLLWCETAVPNYEDAKTFAEGVRAAFPDKMLAYNCSPSFNWSTAGMSDGDIASFQKRMGELGFVWQFITVAGFHIDALATDLFAREYRERGMLAYVEMVQRREEEFGVETWKHQRWSGADLMDFAMNAASSGRSSTLSLGHGVTEDQF